MLKRLAFAGLLIGSCDGSPSAPSPESPPATDRVGRWQEDIDQLARELPSLHVDPFVVVSREVFQREADSLRNAVPSLDDPGVVVGMMRLVALLGDSHTTLDTRGFSGFRRLPLLFEWFADGIFVVAAGQGFERAVGRRVDAVGGVSIDAAITALRELIAHENEWWLRVRLVALLSIPEVLEARGLVPDSNRVSLELTDATEESLVLEVPAVPERPGFEPGPDPLPLYRRQPDLNYWLVYLEDSQTAYVQYRRASEMGSEPFSTFASRVLATLDAEPARTLVIDVRHNTGGNSALLEPLLRGLEARPEWSGGDGLYAVIGRSTFSSGLINAFDLKRRTRALLVGEPTGGKPNHFGEVRSFPLQHSRMPVTYSTRFFRLIDGTDPSSLDPDVRVELTSTDFFDGRDPVLETILTLAGN
ncbi:MAG TPA: hypothetical protein VEK15_32645 [Vicinamibacteria bacterium]|nr:hypothetical protein [Vicinamibacteria bacterium]